jgi:hypothetical protein
VTDNTQLSVGVAGDVVRDIDRGAAKTQVVQLDAGGQSVESLVSQTKPLPVQELDGVGQPVAASPDSPYFVTVVGDPAGDFSGVNLLEQAMTDGSGFGLNVKILNTPKVDAQGAAVISDAPIALQVNLPVGATYLIDTTGYQSLQITTQSLAGSITATNDLKTYQALTGVPLLLGAYVTAVAANLSYWFPCAARYVAITPTTAGTATIYLRAQPWNGSYTTSVPTSNAANNVTQFGSTNVVTAGVAGIPSVGGNVAPGAARTVNPLSVGGVDSANLVRTLLTDTSGRALNAPQGVDPFGVQRQIGAAPTGPGGGPSMFTQDVGVFDGQAMVDLLGQILIEARLQNYYLHQFIVHALAGNAPEDPASLRQDPTSLN